MKIVTHMGTLKAMAKEGHIVLDRETGEKVKHWSGREVKAYYVYDGTRIFTYKGRKYGIRYFDGCFKPFVVDLEDSGDIRFV